MARPTKEAEDKKRILVQFRLLPNEKIALTRNAKEKGLSVTDFIKLKTLDIPPKHTRANPQREILIKSLGDLGRIGGNINQIARSLNRNGIMGQDFDSEQINAALLEIKKLSDLILNELADGD